MINQKGPLALFLRLFDCFVSVLGHLSGSLPSLRAQRGNPAFLDNAVLSKRF